MITYNELKKTFLNEYLELGDTPELETRFQAMGQGVVSFHDSEQEAISALKKRGVKSGYMIKKVETQESKEKIRDFIQKESLIDAKVNNEWEKKLREEFYYLSDDAYSFLYHIGYERGHAYGYDEMYSYMPQYESLIHEFDKFIKQSIQEHGKIPKIVFELKYGEDLFDSDLKKTSLEIYQLDQLYQTLLNQIKNIEPKEKWYAYVDENVIVCDSEKEARRQSKYIEKFQKNLSANEEKTLKK